MRMIRDHLRSSSPWKEDPEKCRRGKVAAGGWQQLVLDRKWRKEGKGAGSGCCVRK